MLDIATPGPLSFPLTKSITFSTGASLFRNTTQPKAQRPTRNAQSLKVEFIRGEGMGGGGGVMVYSIRNGNIICSHANHRGDIIARSDSSGSLISYALYEAYGTRP